MQIFYWPRLHDLIEIEQNLKEGVVLGGYTDTVIGLFANSNKEGLSQLNYTKKREKKPYICLVSSVEKAKKLVHDADHELLTKISGCIWPGPVTVIFQVSSDYNFVSKDNTIAIRIPNHKQILRLLENFDALFSTSANVHGKPIPTKFTEIDESIKSHLGGFIEDSKENKQKNAPSTIIRIEGDKIIVLRSNLDQETQQKLTDAGFVF